jgi:dipeptidyl aminopeptidase/acylaminoacyl peptidase
VVLPHGGPASRDEWGFDWLAQYLANQGYAVLQPNFRGSSGYGDQWLQQNGYRGWRTSVGDITAGVERARDAQVAPAASKLVTTVCQSVPAAAVDEPRRSRWLCDCSAR